MNGQSAVAPIALAVLLLASPPAAAFDSDDFNRHNLDPTRWALVNPLGDGGVRMVGAGSGDARVVLSVPEGPSHDPYNASNRAVRIVQPIVDADFELEAKFDSEPFERFQLQGLMIEQNAQNWIRFDVFHDGATLRIFSATTVNGSSNARINAPISTGDAAYLRVTRVGDQWTFWRSADGNAWVSAVSFAHAINASAAGVFVANHASGGDSPAFDAIVDYCIETSSPLVDDGGSVTADTLAPLIHRVSEGVGPGELVVSWGTDERALGRVEYGPTTAYEFGEVSDPGGLFDHAIALPGLTPGSTYHYRVFSGDSLGNIASTGDFEFVFDPDGPTIDVWYGQDQSFGAIGHPQPWANVLGNVSDVDGVSQLDYSLNGAPPVALSIGPDGRRLLSAGDFNVDLATSALSPGANTVVITATDGIGNVSTDTVTVHYEPAPIWPLPYDVAWDALASDDEIQDVGHVVDGKWGLEGATVRTLEPGYDRLIAMGDVAWDDYEVLVPITIHSTPGGFGAGILFRWNGHTDVPVQCGQPKCGYLPLGAILWARPSRIEVYGNGGSILDTQSRAWVTEVVYWFRGQVETNAQGGVYRLKVWEDGQPEPPGWDIEGQENLSDPQNGSMMLISHLADVSFGPVSITALPSPPNTPPTANDDTRFVEPLGSLPINVLVNDSDPDGTLNLASVSLMSPPLHGNATVDTTTGFITYVHVDSTQLMDSFTYTVEDNDGAVSNAATVTINITAEPVVNVASDDFNACGLDASLWSFVNPDGLGSYEVVGAGSGDAYLALSLPQGTAHDAWGAGGANESVRVMQAVLDTDFEVQVRFNAEPTDGFNDQGLLIEQDPDNWIRYDVYHNGSSLKSFIGTTIAGSNTARRNADIPVGTALALRVVRTGNVWAFWRSTDGVNWVAEGSFVQPLSVNEVGIYAANPIGALAFTSQADYFLSPLDPIDAEDVELNSVTVHLQGNGSVHVSPAQQSFDCGQSVVLTPVPFLGWVFDGWSGDLAGSADPETLIVSGPADVTATFVPAVGVEPAGNELSFALGAAHPNPTSAGTTLGFTLPHSVAVRIGVYDVVGRRIRTLVDAPRAAGRHVVFWDGRDDSGRRVGAGVYLCRMEAGVFADTRRIVLVK